MPRDPKRMPGKSIASLKGPILDVARVDAGLPSENLFCDRTGSAFASRLNAATEGKKKPARTEALALYNVAEARQQPYLFLQNLVMDSLDDAQAELSSSLAAMAGKQGLLSGATLLLCHSTPREYIGSGLVSTDDLFEKLESTVASLGPGGAGLIVVLGSGWARPVGLPVKSDADMSMQFEELLRKRFLDDLEDSRHGFLGELCFADGGRHWSEIAALRAAVNACKDARRRNPNLGKIPILVSLSEMQQLEQHASRTSTNQQRLFLQVSEAFEQVSTIFRNNGGVDHSELVISGLVEAIPALHLENVSENIELLVRILQAQQSVSGLVVNQPIDIERTEVVALAVATLYCEANVDIMLGSGTRFKTDLRRYGGQGLVEPQQHILRMLAETDKFSQDELDDLGGGNLVRYLAWFQKPDKVKEAPKPRWVCDACGKSCKATREPFIRLEFKYCSVTCMQSHKKQLEEAEPKNGNNSDKGPGRSARSAGSSSWGISVGT